MKYIFAIAISVIAAVPAFSNSFAVRAQTKASAHTTSIPNFRKVVDGVYRGGRPTANDIAALKRDGFRTIISVEDSDSVVSKEEAAAQKNGLTFHNYPMSASKTPNDASVATILGLLEDESLQPIFLHCKHGEDRTGLIFGLYRVDAQKWAPKDAYAEMLDLGFHPYYAKLTDYFTEKTGYKP